jgi:hypothetical protein
MAMDILFFGGFKDGEILIDTADAAINPYYGGSPATIGALGVKLAQGSSPQVDGLFKNSWELDSKGDVQVAEQVQTSSLVTTLSIGSNKVKLFADGTDIIPYKAPPSGGGAWVMGDLGYVDATGVIDNQAATAKDAPILHVSKVVGAGAGPDSIEGYQIPMSLANAV